MTEDERLLVRKHPARRNLTLRGNRHHRVSGRANRLVGNLRIKATDQSFGETVHQITTALEYVIKAPLSNRAILNDLVLGGQRQRLSAISILRHRWSVQDGDSKFVV